MSRNGAGAFCRLSALKPGFRGGLTRVGIKPLRTYRLAAAARIVRHVQRSLQTACAQKQRGSKT